jgi:hypothetical protein
VLAGRFDRPQMLARNELDPEFASPASKAGRVPYARRTEPSWKQGLRSASRQRGLAETTGAKWIRMPSAGIQSHIFDLTNT